MVWRAPDDDVACGYRAPSDSTASPAGQEDQRSEGELSDSDSDVPGMAMDLLGPLQGSGVAARQLVSPGQPGKPSSFPLPLSAPVSMLSVSPPPLQSSPLGLRVGMGQKRHRFWQRVMG